MPPSYLLDSDVLIWFLRGREDTVALIRELKRSAIPGYSALSALEVMGWVKREEIEETEEFFRSLQFYSFEEKTAFLAARYLREYRAKGKTLEPFDVSIAATAVLNDLVLVTYNTKDFPMPELKIYPIKMIRKG
ncbi:MAG TPA: PIN domain-containing protein [Candidatus Brocadiales bacterium]|nr:PIN domain-containing protein [Candidatus Brocadiales bacterium]